MHQVLTVQEAATVLRTHPNIVRRLLHQGALGGFRVGRTWRITEADMDAYMATQGRLRHQEQAQWQDLMKAQETALYAVWDNDDDAVWDHV